MKIKVLLAGICAAVMMTTALAGCGSSVTKTDTSANSGTISKSESSLTVDDASKSEPDSQTKKFTTPRERLAQEPQDSPEWVTKMDAARNAKQLFVVAGYERSTAWISMHEKDENGNWKMIMSTP